MSMHSGQPAPSAIIAAAAAAMPPPHPSHLFPLPPPTGAASRSTAASRIRPGLAMALREVLTGTEAKVATLISRSPMYVGKAAALNPGGLSPRRRKRGAPGSLREGMEAIGALPSTITVAPGAAGGKRFNFQPETLRQVARTLANNQSTEGRAAINAVVTLRLGEQADRARRDGMIALAEVIRTAGGRHSSTGALLNRAQSLAIARYLLQKHEAEEVDSPFTASLSRDAADIQAVKEAMTAAKLPSPPFVMAHPHEAPLRPDAVPWANGLRQAFDEEARFELEAALKSVRQRIRNAALQAEAAAEQAAASASESREGRREDEAAQFAVWMAEIEGHEAAVVEDLAANGCDLVQIAAVQEVFAEARAARVAAAAEGNYSMMHAGWGAGVPVGATIDDPVLGADARSTTTLDDARRQYVAWMTSQDRREKAFISACSDVTLGGAELSIVRGKVDVNRKLRNACLRRSDFYVTWRQMLERGYDATVLVPEGQEEEEGGTATYQTIDEDV